MIDDFCIRIMVAVTLFFALVCFFLIRTVVSLKRKTLYLNELTQKDELTQAYTRRYFLEILEYHLRLLHRYHNSSAVLMIDVDDFKQINDTHGHLFGDEVLKHIVTECNLKLREGDVLARFGGDEFILLCPLIDREDIFVVIEKIQDALRTYKSIPISISVGVCLFSHSLSVEAIVRCADRALYNAKEKGKNRFECVSP